MAKNYELNIDINNNAEEASQDFNKLNRSIDNTNDALQETEQLANKGAGTDKLTARLDELDALLDSGTLSFREMNKVMQDYQSVAAQAGTETPIGDRAIRAASGLKDQITDLQNRTKLLSSDYIKLDTSLAALNTGAQVFSGIQSAMALTGIESEELQETMVKLQAVQGVSNSISAVTNALNKDAILGIQLRIFWEKAYSLAVGQTTGAMKALRVALVSTGIGAVIVAVGSLIAYWKEFNQWVEKVRNSTTGWGIALKTLLLITAPFIFAINEINKGLKALGITESDEEIAEKKRWEEKKKRLEEEKQLQEEQFNREQKLFDQRIALLEAEGKATFELTQEKIQASIDYQKEIRNELLLEKARILSSIDERTALGKQLAKAQRENLKEIQKQLDESRDAILENENQLKINVLKNNKEKIQSYNDYAEARISAQREIEDLENELLKDGLEKELEINRDAFRRLREDTLKNTELIASERRRLVELYTESEAKAEKEIRDKYKQEELQRLEDTEALLREVKVNSGVETLNLMQSQFQAEMELRIANDKEQERLEKEAAERRKRNIEFSIESTKQSLEVILSLTELFGKKGEKEARRAFNVQKAAQIASATIDTYRNAVSAYGSQFTPVPDVTSPVRGGIAAGIAVAAGLANIAQIASQKFEGGGEGGAVTQPSAAGLEGGAITPEFNVVGDSGINQLAQLQQQPVQAFVVSGDVTTAQALDRNRVQNATL